MACYGGVVYAKGYTNKDFLTWRNEYKKFWIHGAIEALGQAGAQKNISYGKCIMDWYFGGKTAERNWLIEESIKKYPKSYPSAVLVALTERACGKYYD